jgi:NAD(P)-dependent dehydrogenase (short-subunit alcohol dehydrogenase family)
MGRAVRRLRRYPSYLAVRRSGTRPSGQFQEEAFDFGQVETGGLRPLGVGHARGQSGGEQLEAHLVESRARRRYLGDDVGARTGIGEHLLDAPDLPFDTTESPQEIGRDVFGEFHVRSIPAGVSQSVTVPIVTTDAAAMPDEPFDLRDPFDLRGSVALVTGGNGGIGLGMARALRRHGAHVVVWGTNEAKNDAARDELVGLVPLPGRTMDGDVVVRRCDVGDRHDVFAAVGEVTERFGRLDACFVNAGVGGRAQSFLEMTDDEWRRVMRVNLDGAFHTAQAAVAAMVERGEGGSLVFTTSGSAYFGQQRGQHYGASKAGLISMMRAIAVEHARDGIRSNAVLPGWIESEMTAPAFGWDRFVDRVLPRVPLRRWGRPDDFGAVAVYLAGAGSSYLTGDVITIDGGYHSF